jgi:hypothetical protein
MRSCLAVVGCGGLILAVAVAGWFGRDRIAEYVSGFLNRDEPALELAEPAAPALARRAEEKIIALGQGEIEEATLSAEELDGWVRHGLKGYFPAFVSDVAAGIEEERLVLAGQVAMRELPGLERLGAAAALLGDTARVTVRGRVDGLSPGRGVYYVDNVQVGLLTLPDPVRDGLIEQLKGKSDTLPANALAFVLPDFVTDVGIRGDHIVLRR